MRLKDIKGLTYEGEAVGVRFYIDNGEMWDLEIGKLAYLGLANFKTGTSIAMFDQDGTLVTKDELKRGTLATDISENSQILERLKAVFSQAKSPRDLARLDI